MKKFLCLTSATFIGVVSQATGALTVSNVGASDLATELRALNKTDWALAVSSGSLATSAGWLVKNNTIDDGPVTIVAGTTVLVESIYKSASFENEFGVVTAGPTFGPTLLTNLNLNESKKITSESSDTQELGFATDLGGMSPGGAAGIVSSSMNDNVWTFVGGTSNKTHLLWLLEDIKVGVPNRDSDFNDFIVLGTISAVPEPATIISFIAVGFLGFVTWRNRRKARN
ncbi:MAG: PEP-CTERM sorting domain-containing protein [Opitutaceae bacterium]